jgi:hypothetical protein
VLSLWMRALLGSKGLSLATTAFHSGKNVLTSSWVFGLLRRHGRVF